MWRLQSRGGPRKVLWAGAAITGGHLKSVFPHVEYHRIKLSQVSYCTIDKSPDFSGYDKQNPWHLELGSALRKDLRLGWRNCVKKKAQGLPHHPISSTATNIHNRECGLHRPSRKCYSVPEGTISEYHYSPATRSMPTRLADLPRSLVPLCPPVCLLRRAAALPL